MRVWNSKTIKQRVGCGRNLYVSVLNGSGNRVIIQMGKSGQCHRAMLEGIQNLVNLALEGGIGVEDVIRCLRHIRCEAPTLGNSASCVDFIARILEEEVR